MHVKAKAADIRIPGVGTEALANLIKVIGVGGVGTYISKNFVHLDVGSVRTWRQAYYSPHEESWLADYSALDLESVLVPPDTPEQGRIVYA
ncbi:Uncharacterized protein AC501_3521 [Pseudomonas amygdali pv. lachrymans]|nr:Uncharacterized protein AC501_3521 [Pseudomonas amygdali pv. lachrymans]